jgi:hypothetical protein
MQERLGEQRLREKEAQAQGKEVHLTNQEIKQLRK